MGVIIVGVLLRHPGAMLLVMTLWWVLPLLAVNLMGHPFLPYMKSHLLYAVIILISVLSTIVLNAVNTATTIWGTVTDWGRYYILCAAYTIQMIVTLLIVLTLDSYRLIGYYKGDPTGSVGMLLVPSVVMYFVLGVVSSWGCKVGSWIRKQRTRNVI